MAENDTKITSLDVLQDRIRATLTAHTQTNDTTTIRDMDAEFERDVKMGNLAMFQIGEWS